MTRFYSGVLLIALPLAAPAQSPPSTKLTIHPAATSSPALKYRLLPEQRDLTPGNAVQPYYRAFSPDFWLHNYRDAKFNSTLDERLQAPLEQLRGGEQKSLWNVNQLKEIDRGARRQYCDWEFVPRLREDGIAMLLPDIQSFRIFGKMLAARARQEMAHGRFDDAAYTLQTVFALSRDLGDGPILIQSLVGVAIAGGTLQQVESWVQQPGTPNLYWPLTNLPRPFINLRKAVEGEKVATDQLFGDLRDMLRRQRLVPLPAEDLAKRFRLFQELPAPDVLTATKLYLDGKQFLTDQHRSAAEIEALPVLQVILLHQVAMYDKYFDEQAKWQNVPYPAAHGGYVETEKALRMQASRYSIANLLLPALSRVQFASVRTQRRIDALRVVEALRLFAANHGGELPETLDAITEVPVPLDPATGTPFAYKREGAKATLHGPAPTGEAVSNALHYEITLVR